MDGTTNAILSLATDAFEQRISLNDALRDHVPVLIDKGVPLPDLLDAQQQALDPRCASLLSSYIGKICAEIGARGSPGGLPLKSLPPLIASVLSPSAIHLAVAGALDERTDRQSLQLASEHYRVARRWLESTSEEYAGSLLQEGDVRRRLSELGVDPLYNLTLAIESAQQSRQTFPAGSRSFGVAEMNEGIAHDLLANLGVSPREHLETAVRLYRQARSVFQVGTDLYASSQFNEAASCVYLAELAVDPIETLNTAVSLCEAARWTLSDPSRSLGLTLLNEGQARRGLAEWGERVVDNLRTAAIFLHRAQSQFGSQEYDWRLAVEGEAGALRDLAEQGIDVIASLNRALTLLESLDEWYEPGTLPHAQHNVSKADLYLSLARQGATATKGLSAAVELCQDARRGFDPTGVTHARAFTTEGHARLLQADLGDRPDVHYKLALALYEQSEKAYATDTSNWAIARRNASRSLWRMGLITEAYERLKSGLPQLEKSRRGLWTERERIAFAEAVSGQYQDAVAICLDGVAQATDANEKDRWRREAWHQVHHAKNRALLDLLQGARPRLSANERALWDDLENLFAELDKCEERIREHYHSRARAAHPREWFLQLGELEQERSALARSVDAKRAQALKEVEGADTFLSVEAPPLENVRRDLFLLAKQCAGPTQRSLLVEFFLLDDGRVVVFLVPLWDMKTLEIEQIPLAPGFAARLVGEVLATTDPSFRSQTRAAQASGQLGESARVHLERLIGHMGVLVEPWASRLDDWQPTELIFASHSFLNLLPIHAAPFHGKPLVTQFPVAYLPSATLAEVLGRRKGRDIDTALLIGNPTQDLRGAQLEVQRTANQFGGADIKVECFIGSHATSDCVRTHAPGSSVVHFACHSGIDHDDFLRSGFLLSDRRVTVLEIMTLDLKRASLVYLSSCDSARPVVGRTEELMALGRSFLYAGSPTVIASLWPLDDNAGRIFAESFYDAWLSDRDSMIQAFQSAMLRTSEMEPDPLCWAPFIMIGAW